MAAEDLISWEDFKELRAEIEAEEATLTSRIQMVVEHQALLSADFDLALDIAIGIIPGQTDPQPRAGGSPSTTGARRSCLGQKASQGCAFCDSASCPGLLSDFHYSRSRTRS
ncbi:hypothetical protein ACFLX9_01710 [Chloroflexota bacterium]